LCPVWRKTPRILLGMREVERRGLRTKWHIQPIRRSGDLDVKVLTKDFHFSFRLVRQKFGWYAALAVITAAVVDLVGIYFISR
jgi:hypothetical protein